jgi:hypothetical protein
VSSKDILSFCEKRCKLTHADAPVPGRPEVLPEGDLVLRHGRVIRNGAVHVRIPSGHQGCTAGGTLRVLGKGLIKPDAGSGQSIDVGRADDGISVTSDTVGPQLV